MARRLFIFDAPDRFVPGTLGEVGARTFYLQAREGRAVVTVALEKAQVAALAGRISELLDAVEAAGAASAATSTDADRQASGAGGFDEPLVELFRVGAMALSWDSGAERVIVEAQPLSEDGDYVELSDEAEVGPDLVRVRIRPDQARAFVRQAAALIAAGRPTCPFCGRPLEPTGHFCASADGNLN
jgi:uncharacterized repeat protein (TIGR03847 family)